ncbi:DNA-binding transcriptional LysR family regulator [Williamsia muralis]|uniref:DNA-binding transcriptional LysR family regulator n=1 Tax=Williamsia marianensis TaxID=85044 RepID=A0A495K129_WILMA|nr:LysR family transcriptional regulator [Williamsia muralis]RKR94967.1 DNA-binding transcriptional LysR family regulator [Williamsia muralis]
MELRQLTYFVAVAEELSFSRAAQRCFISQSAISHQVARLEHELGSKLIERSTRAVRLTELGAQVLPLARQMLGIESMITAAARAPGGRVRMAANMSFAQQSLAAIAQLRTEHLDVEIEFIIKSFDQRIDAVLGGDVDLALIRGDIERPGLAVQRLWVDDLVVAMSDRHPLAGTGDVPLAELGAYPLLLPPARDQVLLHNVIRDAFDRHGLDRPRQAPPLPVDHTATMELLNHPDEWTVLYERMPLAGIAFTRDRERALRVPVSAVVRSPGAHSEIVDDLIATLQAVHRRTGDEA